jgi:CubicO group peptidase (beta-lactamase class C family)
MRGLVAGAAITLTLLRTASLDAQAPADSALARMERAVRAEMAARGIPGVALALVRGDSVVYARGFGVASAETGEPVTPEMLFQVGSATKMLTGALVASLAEEGMLSLDAPVGTYVSGLHPAIARLTLHQLLSNSGGMKDEAGGDGLHEEAALLAYARGRTEADLALPPGAVFSYSNPGFALAGLAAQEVAGQPFAELARERLFAPLGMARTTFRPLEALTHPAARGHAGSDGGPRVVRPYADDTRIRPAGYAWSSAAEMARFARALLGGRIDGRQVIPVRAVERMAARHVAVPNVFDQASYGYGLFVGRYRGEPSAWHDGQMPGFGAFVRVLPGRGLGVVVLMNREGVRPDAIEGVAFDALGVLAPPPDPPRPAPELAMTAEEMAGYAGRYVNRWTVELFVRDGALFRRWVGQEQRVYKVRPHRFTVDPARANPALEFDIVPAEGDRPAYVHLFLWALPRVP